MSHIKFYPVYMPQTVTLAGGVLDMKVYAQSGHIPEDLEAVLASAGFVVGDKYIVNGSWAVFTVDASERISVPKPVHHLKKSLQYLKTRHGLIVSGHFSSRNDSLSRVDFYPGSVSIY